MMKKYFVFVAVVAIAVIFSSCAKVPQAEIDAAKAALEQAQVAQADLYLQSEFMALQDSLNAVTTQIEAKKSKLFGSFADAKEKLAMVSAQATELVGKTEVRKEEIKVEVAAVQTAVATLMEENAKMVAMAPKGKEGKEAIEAIKSDLGAIDASVAEIPALLESGDLLGAQTKANAAQQKATEINTELKTVLAKYMKK